MKVFLINPPAPHGIEIVREGRCMQRKGAWTAVWSPISLAYCAAVLEQAGFQVKISDCIVEHTDNSSLLNQIRKFRPQLVILNTSTPSIDNDLSVVNLIKTANPKIKTAVFGIHVSALPQQVIKQTPGLDFVIIGEPEYTSLSIAESIRQNQNPSSITGIAWGKTRTVIINPPRPPIENLDEIPFPAWHLINKENYIMPFTDHPFFLVATGRGCPYNCLFCADKTYYGHRLRLRSPKSIVDELAHNQNTFHISDFLFWSESFTINKAFATAVCDEILKRHLKVHWVANSRVDNIDLPLLKKFKQAGCWMIGYGIESGNQKILNFARKGTTIKQAKTAVKLAKAAGLEVTGHCLIGLPQESTHTIKQTVQFAKHIGLDFAQFYCAVPFPGSDLYQLAQKQGWIASTDWSMYEQNFSVLSYKNLSAQQIMNLRQAAYKSFYLSPHTILKTLSRIRNPKQFINFLSMAANFLNWVK